MYGSDDKMNNWSGAAGASQHGGERVSASCATDVAKKKKKNNNNKTTRFGW